MTALPRTRRPSGALVLILRILGAALLFGLAVIHLYLWQQGYDSIDVIGPAFLLDTVLGFGGALLVLITPLRWLPVAAVLGALLCLGTLGALIVSTTVGLFGFVESTAAQLWGESLAVEAAGFVVLVALALLARGRARAGG
jgi:hypothetical protein